MAMTRGIIRMTEGGRVSMPLTDVWMTKEEIADMFGLPEALVFRTIWLSSQPISSHVALFLQEMPPLCGRHVIFPAQSQIHIVRRTEATSPRHLIESHVCVS